MKLKNSIVLFVLLAGTMLLSACGNTDVAAVAAKADVPEKVVALSKSNAELWILAGGSLAATSDDAMEIEGLNEDAVSLGDMDHVNQEAVVALAPDMVILFSTDPPQKQLGESLEALGVNVKYTNVDSFSDYAELMEEFTALTGREDLYEEYVLKQGERIEEIKAEAAGKNSGKYLLLHVSATKSKAEKNDYFACEIFNSLGLENIASDDSALNELSLEAILSEDPDYIFVVPRGDEAKAMASFDELFAGQSAWSSLTAVKGGRYYLLSKELFGLKPNAEWSRAYEEALKLLDGQQ